MQPRGSRSCSIRITGNRAALTVISCSPTRIWILPHSVTPDSVLYYMLYSLLHVIISTTPFSVDLNYDIIRHGQLSTWYFCRPHTLHIKNDTIRIWTKNSWSDDHKKWGANEFHHEFFTWTWLRVETELNFKSNLSCNQDHFSLEILWRVCILV